MDQYPRQTIVVPVRVRSCVATRRPISDWLCCQRWVHGTLAIAVSFRALNGWFGVGSGRRRYLYLSRISASLYALRVRSTTAATSPKKGIQVRKEDQERKM